LLTFTPNQGTEPPAGGTKRKLAHVDPHISAARLEGSP
jgi:hypothetical protein